MSDVYDLTSEMAQNPTYQAALDAYAKNMHDTMKSLQKSIDFSGLIEVQLARQIKLPDFSKLPIPPLATKQVITSLASNSRINIQPIIDQLKQVPDLSAFNTLMPTTKLISRVVKSAALANRLSFSSSVLSKDLLKQTIKIPATDWEYHQDNRHHHRNLQSALNSKLIRQNPIHPATMLIKYPMV